MKRIITSLILALCITATWAQNDIPVITSLPECNVTKVGKQGICIKRMQDKTYVYIVSTCKTDNEQYKIGGKENTTYIEDVETGTHYQMRGVKDNVVPLGGNGFRLRGMRGKRWAVAVEFPPLPKEVRRIRFWHLCDWLEENYNELSLLDMEIFDEKTIAYDDALPEIITPKLIKEAVKYSKYDKHTFPVYGDEATVVTPTATDKLNTTAVWCTKNATYVATLWQINWDLHYFQQSSNSCIVDCKTGEKYKIKSTLGLPLDMSYNIKGASGEWVCNVDVYPPLPETCTTIDIMEESIGDNVQNGPGWGGALHLSNVPVARLQANQGIVKFRKTAIVK